VTSFAISAQPKHTPFRPFPLMPLASQPIRHQHQHLQRTIHSLLNSINNTCPPSIRVQIKNSKSFQIRLLSTRTVRKLSLQPRHNFIITAPSKRTHMGGHHHHGHEHGAHGHVHDTTLLTSKDTTNPGVRITRIGLYSPCRCEKC
jgi:hypothetical protein